MKGSLVSQDETMEDTQIRVARAEGIKAFQALNADAFVDEMFEKLEKGAVEVTGLADLKNITDEFNIVGSHKRGCGCTSERRNPECYPTRNLPN